MIDARDWFSRRFFAAVVFACSPLVLGAQAASDSTVSVAPLLRALAREWGARILVIDSAEIAASTAPTFSELLQARLPGLRVLRSGGMASDGSLVMLRGPVSFLESSQPLVFVDGVRVDAEQADTLPVIGAVSPSRLDDLPVEEIARIEVLSGAAAAAYGDGAAAGVILVTTRSGGGPLRLGGRAQMLSGRAPDDFPANYQRRGTSPATGQPLANCSLLVVAAQQCNPTGLDVWNPLEQASPFRTARSGLARLSLTGSPLGSALYASVGASQREGVLPHDEVSQLSYRAKIERALPWNFSVRASHAYRRDNARMGMDGGYSLAGDVISAGLFGEAVNDANRGYYTAGGQVADSLHPDRRLRHTTSAVGLSWGPRQWLQASLMTGRDRVVDRWRVDDFGPVGSASFPFQRGDDEHWRLTTTGRIRSSYSLRGNVTGTSSLVLDWQRTRISARDSASLGSFLSSTSESQFRNTSRSVSFLQGFDLPYGISVNGSLHRVARSIFGSSEPWEWFPAANVSWRLRPMMSGRSTVRLRVAYAELPGVTPTVLPPPVPVFPSPGVSQERIRMERSKETEIGADASLERLVNASITLFQLTSEHLFDYGVAPPSGTGGSAVTLVPNAGEIRNRGLEALVKMLLIERGEFQWTATLSAASLSNRVTRFKLPPQLSNYGITREGSPVGAVRAVPYTFADANHDGIIDVSEVHLLPEMVKPSLPTFEAGIASDLRIARGLTLSALGDYRRGNMVANQEGQLRCLNRRNCRAAQDPTAPLADQAAVAAVVVSGGQPVMGFVSDGSFFKLRELALRWHVPTQWSHYFGGDAAITIAGRNLLTATNYSGIDPEISTSRPGVLPRVEFARNPLPREFLLRVDLGAGSPQ